MSKIQEFFNTILRSYNNEHVSTTVIASVLFVVALLAAYEFIIYRVVSKRAFYNKSFHISLAAIPFFIATIILCLQSNLVITLGTIGALAIVRFRTAVKDPVDMIYILWSLHTGIVCGCQLYEVAVLTSLAVTVVLLVLEYVNFSRKPFVLVLHCKENAEARLVDAIKAHTKKFKIKSRNFTLNGVDYAIELSVKDPQTLTEALSRLEGVDRFSVIEYDSEDII